MGITRIVNTSFWTDEKIIDNFSKDDKLFYLYILTNPHCRQVGIYKIPKRIMEFETGFNAKEINLLIDKFESEYNMIQYSQETQEIAILNYLRYSIISGGKPVLDCIKKDLKLVKNKNLIDIIYNRLLDFNNKSITIQSIIDIMYSMLDK